MAYIDAGRFTELKERVRAECLRRCNIGSVADYGGSEYEFNYIPEKGKVAVEDHYEKLAVPLAAINSDKVPGTDGDRIISNEELEQFEVALTEFESRAMTDTTQGDCKSSCTGACYTGCTGSCSGGCGSNCSGTCTGTCWGCWGCYGTCYGSCTGCGSGCASSCSGTCSGGCSDTCTVTCGYAGCVGACVSSCVSGCVTGCSQNCGDCGTNCTAVSK